MRPVLFSAGLSLAVLALVSPLDAIGDEYLLSGHMLQHVLIADAAPALMLVAIRGPLAFFLLPKSYLRPLAASRALRAALAFLLRPTVCFLLWCIVILGWHIPAAYEYALDNSIVHDLEHVSFLLIGTLVWIQLVDPTRHERLRPPGRILFAFGLLIAGHPVVDVLFFEGALYDTYALQDERLLGLSPSGDQQVASFVMFVEQMLTLGTCAVVLLWPYVRARRRRRAHVAPAG